MKILFAGPTLARHSEEVARRGPELQIAGPVSRGDVMRAVDSGARAIGLVDGRFEDVLSVWHKEILFALSRGVTVAGAASMGALRAAECAAFGMVGIGKVFRGYAEGRYHDDADVAQLHGPEELGYVALTEPLVNVSASVDKLAACGLLTGREASSLLASCRRLHFKQRTYGNIVAHAALTPEHRSQAVLELLERHGTDQKAEDGLELVDWLQLAPARPRANPDWTFSATSHWHALTRSVRAAHPADSRSPVPRQPRPRDGGGPIWPPAEN